CRPFPPHPSGREGLAAAHLLRAVGRPGALLTDRPGEAPRWQREQLAKLPRAMAHVAARLANHPNVFHPEVGPALAQAVTLAENLGQSPILGGNVVELLVDYDETIARLVADIDQAESHVHLQFYTVAGGEPIVCINTGIATVVDCGVLFLYRVGREHL